MLMPMQQKRLEEATWPQCLVSLDFDHKTQVRPLMLSSLSSPSFIWTLFFFLKRLFTFRQGKGEKKGVKHQCVVASGATPTGDLACNPGTCPDRELNQLPFGSRACPQSTEPHQPGQDCFLKYIFLIMLLQLSQYFQPLPTSTQDPPSLQQPPCLSSCPWVVHISSLASPFPILFLTFPCLFCTYQLCFLFPVPFPPFFPFPLPADNPPNGLHTYDSVPVLVVCWVCFLDSVVDSCEFVVILLFIVLIFS